MRRAASCTISLVMPRGPIMDAMRFGFKLVGTTAFALLAAITGAPIVMGAPPAPSPVTQISAIPDKFVMPEAQKDYLKRIEMIPMRDGVRLYTVIIVPKGAKDAPIVLTRTPNNAQNPVSNNNPSMEALLPKAASDRRARRLARTRRDRVVRSVGKQSHAPPSLCDARAADDDGSFLPAGRPIRLQADSSFVCRKWRARPRARTVVARRVRHYHGRRHAPQFQPHLPDQRGVVVGFRIG